MSEGGGACAGTREARRVMRAGGTGVTERDGDVRAGRALPRRVMEIRRRRCGGFIGLRGKMIEGVVGKEMKMMRTTGCLNNCTMVRDRGASRTKAEANEVAEAGIVGLPVAICLKELDVGEEGVLLCWYRWSTCNTSMTCMVNRNAYCRNYKILQHCQA